MPNDSKQLSYLKRNAARSKDILLLVPNHVLAAAHDLCSQIEANFEICSLALTPAKCMMTKRAVFVILAGYAELFFPGLE